MFLTKTFTAGNETYKAFPFLGELIMEAFLIENPNALNLGAEEFEEAKILGHQISLRKGSKNKEGRIDILAAYGNRIAIIELKKGQIDEGALKQLNEYLNAREQIADLLLPSLSGKDDDKSLAEEFGGYENIEWIGVLAGTSVEPRLALEMRNGKVNNNEDQIPVGAITINRYAGEKNRIYTITDTYFPEKINGRDYTKYKLEVDGQLRKSKLSKNRLALELVQCYSEKHADKLTMELLLQSFDKSIQGSKTVMPFDEAKDGRSFKKSNEVIQLVDGSVFCVSNQWGKTNIERMISKARELMPEIKIYVDSDN